MLTVLSETAIVVLGDLTFLRFGENKDDIATKILFDTAVEEKTLIYNNYGKNERKAFCRQLA